MSAPERWRVFLPDPWVWERWMLDALEAGGCQLTLGAPAFEPGVRPLSQAAMASSLAGADGMVIHSRERVSAEALHEADGLRVIAKLGIGVEKIDVRAATAAGILVTNTPVAENYQGLAEATVALLLALVKRLPAKERSLRAGQWRTPDTAGDLLEEHTLGIVGLGRVGSRVADLLRGWPIKIVAADPKVSADAAARHGVELVPFAELLARASIVSLHTAPRAGDPPVLGRAELAAMRPGSYLINTSRGGVVDENALVDALQRGDLAGAALDVFSIEPLPEDHLLRSLDNVILTPHAIGTSRASQRAICRAAVDCCLTALAGEVPPYVVNPEAIPAWRERLSRQAVRSAP
jgi:phosphoglycerate dehydrogenase-like enzyme